MRIESQPMLARENDPEQISISVVVCAYTDDRWDALVQAATFESMKAKADVLAPDTTHKIWQDNAMFFQRGGGSGSWRVVMGDDELPRYRARVDALASPDLVEWLHQGSLAPA